MANLSDTVISGAAKKTVAGKGEKTSFHKPHGRYETFSLKLPSPQKKFMKNFQKTEEKINK